MIDVSAAVSEYIDSTRPARKSHGGLSVSDVANGCPREVWHRLRSGVPKSFDGPTKKKFEFGHMHEDLVLRALEAKGFKPYRRDAVNFGSYEQWVKDPQNGPFLGRYGTEEHCTDAEAFDADPSAYATRNDLVGHPDHVLSQPGQLTVVEVKTTHLFGKPHPDLEELLSKQGQYVLQTVAYAKAYNAKAVLHVIDRSSGVDRDYDLDVDRFWPLFLARWGRMLPALGETEPEIDLPTWTINAKGQSYLCRDCVATKCANRK